MKRRKLSTIILSVTLMLVMIGVFASNLVLKHVYDKRDKSDMYWNYNKILEQPYKYLKIEGGNVTNIIFEPSKNPSVRVLNYWYNYQDSTVKAYVKNDTLHLTFKNQYRNQGEKFWFKSKVLVRLFAPQLLDVEGSDTNFELQKLQQKSISIHLKGKSRLEVETFNRDFDSLKVSQRDSSQVIFEMSPDLKGSPIMHFKHVVADMTGYTLLDIGRSYADNIQLKLSDSSAVILSGKSLKAIRK
jgi:hypothetical protein